MSNSLDERKLRYDIQRMAVGQLRTELAQLKPGSPSREAEFEKRLKAALNASPIVRFNSLYNAAQLKDHRAKMEAEIYFAIEQKRTLLAERLRPLETKESLAELGDPKQDSAEFAKQLLRLNTSKTTVTPSPPAPSDVQEPTSAKADIPRDTPTVAKAKRTQLEIDREHERQTGKVTVPLLCADYGISPTYLGQLLRRWHQGMHGHAENEISTSSPTRLNRADVATVRERLTLWQEKRDAKSGK